MYNLYTIVSAKPTGASIHHNLKIWPDAFAALAEHKLTFDVRYNDRDYAVGDIIRYHEWSPDKGVYLPGRARATVCSIFRSAQLLAQGTVVLGLMDVEILEEIS